MALTSHQQSQIDQYFSLLLKWNDHFNLVANADEKRLYERHIIDSLSIVDEVTGQRCLDWGTGAGLPGIPLAIAHPEKQFVLLDSNGKKCRFLLQVVGELSLTNVEVVHERVENYRPSACFDAVVLRAVTGLADIQRLSRPHLCEGGRILAMKGRVPQEELAELSRGEECEGVAEVKSLPDIEGGQRCLVVIRFT